MKNILPFIVIAQFFCTSLWFAGNSIISDISIALHLDSSFLGHITSAIQFGFIIGTLVFAILSISDRFSPSKVFFFSAILAGLCNLGLLIPGITGSEILAFRLLTGFFLAGIYPVGMKIASDYFQSGLGKSLGFLVGALVIGTSFPHLLKDITSNLSWKYVVYTTSLLSAAGGMMILLFVPDGPFRKPGTKPELTSFLKGFNNPDFRSVSFGYFGHMWELYTFWAFVPVMLKTYNTFYPEANLNVPYYSFLVIACGGPSCVLGGLLSQKYGAKKIASIALTISCLCCICSPFFLFSKSSILFLSFLLIWGISVIADSPLFSTLVAQTAPQESRGSSLTIVNCIGFSITIISIQLINMFSNKFSPQYIYTFLAIGPVLGLIALTGTKKRIQ
jgi:MFS family permease